jgi:hypothetical protein
MTITLSKKTSSPMCVSQKLFKKNFPIKIICNTLNKNLISMGKTDAAYY